MVGTVASTRASARNRIWSLQRLISILSVKRYGPGDGKFHPTTGLGTPSAGPVSMEFLFTNRRQEARRVHLQSVETDSPRRPDIRKIVATDGLCDSESSQCRNQVNGERSELPHVPALPVKDAVSGSRFRFPLPNMARLDSESRSPWARSEMCPPRRMPDCPKSPTVRSREHFPAEKS